MRAKSLLVNLLTTIILVIGSYGKLFDATTAAWLGVISMTLTSVLSVYFPSGIMVAGWKPLLILFNALGIGMQFLNLAGDAALIPADVVNYIIIGVNIFINVYLKDYKVDPGNL